MLVHWTRIGREPLPYPKMENSQAIKFPSGHVQCNEASLHTASQVPTSHIVDRYLAALSLISMFPGCFSWCRLRMPWDAKKNSTEMPVERPEVSAYLCCAISL